MRERRRGRKGDWWKGVRSCRASCSRQHLWRNWSSSITINLQSGQNTDEDRGHASSSSFIAPLPLCSLFLLSISHFLSPSFLSVLFKISHTWFFPFLSHPSPQSFCLLSFRNLSFRLLLYLWKEKPKTSLSRVFSLILNFLSVHPSCHLPSSPWCSSRCWLNCSMAVGWGSALSLRHVGGTARRKAVY